ncbi:MAG: hypothetical protein MUE72_02675 [Chitinophagaceae bacterium]|jgi:hypothetical protein|nr:hypothetical protein [Chitinophagaceae bacterium]
MLKFITTTIILTLTLSSCVNLFGDPHTTLIKTSPNYEKTKKAVLLKSDGNATVDLSYQVSILNQDYKFSGNELGNTFTVDRNHGATGLDTSSINFNWLSNDTLQIDYDEKLRTFIQEKNINGVKIIYKPR